MKKDSKKRAHKEQERLQKAFERKQRENQFAQKHPFLANFWKKNMKPLLVIAALAALIIIVLIGGSMIKQYKDSLYWADHHDEDVAMADQPPSLIYDKDPASRQAKLNFISIYQSVYDEKTMVFTENVDSSAIDQLVVELENMTDDGHKKEYQTLYDQLAKKWDIEKSYRELFTNSALTTLKPTTTPHKVVQLNNETFELIDTYSKDSNHQDQFAIRIYEWQHKLLEDALKLEQEAVTLSNWLTKDGDQWTVQPDLYPTQFNNYVASVEDIELHYQWQSLNKFYSVVEAMEPITEEYAKRHKHYEKVQTDKANREQALTQVENRLLAAESELNTLLANIEEERQSYTSDIDAMRAQMSALDVRVGHIEEQAANSMEQQQAAQESAEAARESSEQSESAARDAAEESRRLEEAESERSESESSRESESSSESQESHEIESESSRESESSSEESEESSDSNASESSESE